MDTLLIDWNHWLSSISLEQLPLFLAPILLLDMPRYSFGGVFVCVDDFVRRLLGRRDPRVFDYCPSICVIVAGLNESETIGHTLESLLGTYPRMEVVIVDDGSTDTMSEVSREFAKRHANVLVLRKTDRGGKSSALNMALPFTQAEIVVCVDGDSHLDPTAIWEIVQPFKDPQVGAVSGTVVARNPFTKLVTWLQAAEYLRCIFIGRMFAAKLNILGIISGAFGAYRRDVIERLQGWDVGPGEDGDLALRMRKYGYKIVFSPYAFCYTNLPTSWKRLILQRRRWEWAVVTFECRKHIDMANIFSPNFRFSNFLLVADRLLYNVFMPLVFVGYAVWLCFHTHEATWMLLLTYYLIYCVLDLFLVMVICYFSTNRKRDMTVCLVSPLMPAYNLLMRLVTFWAVAEEALTRRSFKDGFVPAHVREATWHW